MNTLDRRLGSLDGLYACSGGSSGQTNDNQAQIEQNKTQTVQGLTSAQTTLAQAIIADMGNDTPNIPTPPGIPTIESLTGSAMASMSQGGAGTDERRNPLAFDPNETGLINAFNDSANGTESNLLVAGQIGGQSLTATQSQTADSISASQAVTTSAIANAEASAASGVAASANGSNLPLGSQASFGPAPVTETSAAPSGGFSLLPLLFLAAGGFGLWFFIKHEHHGSAAA